MSFISCSSKKVNESNPLTTEWDTPYAVPPFDKIQPQHFIPAIEHGMSLHNAEIDAIVRNNDPASFENVIEAFDRSGEELARTANLLDMLSLAANSDELRKVTEEAAPMLSQHHDRILMNDALFQKIKSIYDERESLSLDAEQLRLTEKIYKQFVRSGALLNDSQKKRLQEINSELALLSIKFAANLMAETEDYVLFLEGNQLFGLTSDIRDQARVRANEMGKEGKYAFTLQSGSLFPFLTYSSDRDKREEMFKAYIGRCNRDNEYDNKPLINDFVRLRTEKAHLLDYKSYADYVISEQMAGSTTAVYKLLKELWTPALDKAKEEYKELNELFKNDFHDEELQPWDWWYYANKLSKNKYSFEEDAVRSYFTLDNAKAGVFFLANRLYGITFRPISVPTYHKDVSAMEVLDVDGEHLGILYFDFYAREGKAQGAWCGNFVEQTYKEGKIVSPVVAVTTNFNRPTYSNPSFLTLSDTETLFHEFGHALHFLFHKVKYRGLSEVEGDLVELPSQLLENWAFEPELLRQYAFHYNSHTPIPEYQIRNIRNTRLFNQGFKFTELLAAAYSDLDLHSVKEYQPFDVNEYEKNALRMRRGLISAIEPRYHYPYFSHIFSGGYASGYYFYIWSEVLDKDAFEAFRESGDLYNREVAERFRQRLLSRGGSQDGMTLYRDFRGKDPDKNALLKARGLIDSVPVVDSLPQIDSLEVPMMDGRYTLESSQLKL